MKEKNQKNKYDIHMTDEEKNRVWDGVLRRATDFPDGKSPFADKPSNWDGTLRRATDFNDEESTETTSPVDTEKKEEKQQ